MLFAAVMCLLAPICQRAQESEWRVQLRANTVAPSSVDAENVSCHRTHRFKIVPDSLPFMKLLDSATFEVAPGEQHKVPVQFDTRNMRPGQYDAVITVQCLTCKSEPGCHEDHTDLHVYLTVLPGLANWSEIHPELKGTVKDNPALRWSNISPDKKPQQ
ncbi:MAG: hypothetical protein ACLP1Y_09295 [Candidatus Acidiferrales bacterium]